MFNFHENVIALALTSWQLFFSWQLFYFLYYCYSFSNNNMTVLHWKVTGIRYNFVLSQRKRESSVEKETLKCLLLVFTKK